MRQVLQSLDDGRTELVDVPVPRPGPGAVLIRTQRTLISPGTERMLLDFGRAGWIAKALQQPEKVRQVLDKVRSDGLLPTIEAVRSKLDQPLPLGYCNVGCIVETGAGVLGLAPGDRVVSNGPHAEWVAVARNLCARVPPEVPDDAAVFVVLAAIALQGIRLAEPSLGERFAVIGLGLIGLLTVQLLRANGCRVLGVDPDQRKSELARTFGAETVAVDQGEDPVATAAALSNGHGVDGVLITAATTSSEPVKQAAQMSRKRGRIVLVGVTGLELDRSDFYRKELSFQVSCSYGPGRYDPEYEEKGHDYPLGLVRWTEQRNFEAVLDLMQRGSLDVRPLVSHRFPLDAAGAAYGLIASRREPYLGVLLDYSSADRAAPRAALSIAHDGPSRQAATVAPRVAFIGAGNYAGRVLIPAFAASGALLCGIASSGGVSAAHYGRKYGFQRVTSDAEALIHAEDVDAVVIATRHDSHARFVVSALQAGKHVFVEKPLALTLDEIDAIAQSWHSRSPSDRRSVLMVGFNRRFAPHIIRMKTLLGTLREPKSLMVTINAGAVPDAHWTQDVNAGGGRIIGEACHFIDVLRFLAGQSIVDSRVQVLGRAAGAGADDEALVTLTFSDGSCGTIHYLANGHRSFPKERYEVFCAGRILQLDNFRRLRAYGWPRFSGLRLWRQDKGQRGCVTSFLDAIRSGRPAPIPFEELIETGRIAITLGEAARR